MTNNLTQNATPNLIQTLDDALTAFSDRDLDTFMAFFDEEATFELVPEYIIAEGSPTIQDNIREFFNWVELGEKQVFRATQDGKTVWVERMDHWRIQGEWIELPIVAIVDFNDAGKIMQWREYYTLEYRKKFEQT